MQGFAVVDNQPDDGTLAIWVTSRVEAQRAGHVNAVCMNLRTDPDINTKVRSLTRNHGVLITDGSTLDSLAVEGDPLTLDDVGDLVRETEAQRTLILEAVAAYARKTRNGNLVAPGFPASPKREHFKPSEDSAPQRALHTANYLARAWTAWLTTDEQRRRRSIQPRTNQAPWIMPEDMSSPEIAEFPPLFAQQIYIQPLM